MLTATSWSWVFAGVPFNTAVLGFHNMDGDGVFSNLNPSQQGVLEAIKSSFTMMESVLNDVLDFQKMEEGLCAFLVPFFVLFCRADSFANRSLQLNFLARKGKFELQARPFDVNSTVRTVAKSLESTAKEKNISIEVLEDVRVDMWGGKAQTVLT